MIDSISKNNMVELTFNNSYQCEINLVAAIVSKPNDNLKFRFGKIDRTTGYPISMIIKVDNIEKMVVDFMSDYLDSIFEFDDESGKTYRSFFKSGIVNFTQPHNIY